MEFDEETEENATPRCRRCNSRIKHGQDVVQVCEGVLGPRGVVRLEENTYCCDECLRDDLCDQGPAAVLRRRIP